MKKNIKNILRLICFLLILAIITLWLGKTFYYEHQHMRARVYTYSTLEENTVDAVYIGTSGVARFCVPGSAYDNYGLSIYPITVDGMQCWSALTTLKYAMDGQSLKVAIFDTRMFTVSDDASRSEYRSRYLVDALPTFSKYRVEAAVRSVKYLSQLTDENPLDITYYFNVLRYHDMWSDEELDFDNSGNELQAYLGYNFTKACSHTKEIPVSDYTDVSTPLTWFAQECLDELIDFCNENNIEILFVNSPHYEDEETLEKLNYLYDYLDSVGVPYMDCVTEEGVEEYPFDRTTDFYNNIHTNYYGAVKFTGYLSEYLIENYGLEDHRGDDKYYQWVDAAEATYEKARSYDLID